MPIPDMGNSKSKKGQDPPVVVAATKGDRARLESLLQDGNSQQEIIQGKHGFISLCKAAEQGYADCVHLLIHAGVQCDSKENWYHSTPLILAAENGHEVCVQMLLGANANSNGRNNEGNTALQRSVDFGSVECVEALLQHRAEINIQNNKGNSALHSAAKNGFDTILERLLEHTECQVNMVDVSGSTALHISAREGAYDCMELLLQNGADPFQRNKAGFSAFDEALVNKHINIVALLLKHMFHLKLPYQLEQEIIDNPTPALCYIVNQCLHTSEAEDLHPILNGLIISLPVVYLERFPLREIMLPVMKSTDILPFNFYYSTSWPIMFALFLNMRLFFIVKALTVAGQEWTSEELHHMHASNPGIYRWALTYSQRSHSLKHIARSKVRQLLGCKIAYGVHKLNLPVDIKNYILLQDCDMF